MPSCVFRPLHVGTATRGSAGGCSAHEVDDNEEDGHGFEDNVDDGESDMDAEDGTDSGEEEAEDEDWEEEEEEEDEEDEEEKEEDDEDDKVASAPRGAMRAEQRACEHASQPHIRSLPRLHVPSQQLGSLQIL